jgi:nucleoside-diphosphate-sugar epimerase
VRLLVIGGTVFLGRAVVDAALARGDDVTYFHRGRHGRGLHPAARELLGDRRTGLPDGEWDAVVDTCGFDAGAVGAAARALADRVAHYGFVSSGSVYERWPVEPVDEESAVFTDDADDYGPQKAAAERAAEAAMPGRVLDVRAGVIVGPHENIGRLPYWLRRMQRGGEVLAPGPRDAPMQLVDARDLAAWMLAMAEARRGGVFNAVAPPGWTTWGELLEACRTAVNPEATLCWVDGERVAAALEDPWTQLPLWPAPVPEMAGIYAMQAGRARAAGLRARALPATWPTRGPGCGTAASWPAGVLSCGRPAWKRRASARCCRSWRPPARRAAAARWGGAWASGSARARRSRAGSRRRTSRRGRRPRP